MHRSQAKPFMARHANNFLGIQLEGPCPILVHVGVSKLGHGGVRIFAWVEWLKVHMRRWAQLKTRPACWLLQDLWLLNFCLWGFFCVGARYLFNLCIPFSFAFALLLGLGFAAVCFGTVFGVAPLGPLGQADALAVRPRPRPRGPRVRERPRPATAEEAVASVTVFGLRGRGNTFLGAASFGGSGASASAGDALGLVFALPLALVGKVFGVGAGFAAACSYEALLSVKSKQNTSLEKLMYCMSIYRPFPQIACPPHCL